MTNTELNSHSNEKGQYDNNTLLMMHEFYAREAQHQRSMMWDTVKWFTPILTAIHSGWFYLYYRNFNYNWLILLSIAGALFTLICFILLHTFYRTNLIYLSMFIKIEDDLNFLERRNRNYFQNDDKITYDAYLKDRLDYKTAGSFVKTTLRKGTMHRSMQYVFCLFFTGFLFELYLVFWKQGGTRIMALWSHIFTIVFGLVGAYFLAFSLKIRAQYSRELIKELKLDEELYTIPTNVSQREGLFWLGIGLITVAALIQIFLLLSRTGL